MLAVNVLKSCYEANQDDAQLLLLREIPEYGNSTALQIAASANDTNLVGCACSQSLLAKIWYGQIFADAPNINVIFFNFNLMQS